jgi:energy-coupling factor transporter ATP-binding protein EcfA2
MGEDVEGLVVDRYEDAELAEVCGGGLMRGGVLLVGGLAGAGKSTLAAELGAIVAKTHDGLVYWLDRDQRNPALIHETFARTGSSRARLAIIQEREVTDPRYVPLTWRMAFDMVPRGAACVVVDSLETWADRTRDRHELLRALRLMDAYVKVVIAPTNALGGVAGERSLPRAGDATITITDEVIIVDKCRWHPRGTHPRWERPFVDLHGAR